MVVSLLWFTRLFSESTEMAELLRLISFHQIHPRHDRRLGGIGRVVPIAQKLYLKGEKNETQI